MLKYQITTDKIVSKHEIGRIYIFYQKHALAILRTGTTFLNLYFFVTITNIIKKNVAKSKIPIPRASQE